MDDGDDEPWTRVNPRTGHNEILRADRFHRRDPNHDENPEHGSQACMGIRVNIWNRAKVRRLFTHSLVGGGTHQLGYDAVDLEFIKRGDAGGQLGPYDVLRFLPDKVAKYVFEFHSSDYVGLPLPAIPEGASSGDIHKMLKTSEVIV